MQIYIPILYVTRMTQNKNDSINSILQHGRVVDKTCSVVFQQCKWKAATTFLAVRTKKN